VTQSSKSRTSTSKRRVRRPTVRKPAARLTPTEKRLRRKISIRRALKVGFYSVAGWVIALGMLLFAAVALHLQVDPAMVVVAQIPLAMLLAGLHKRLEFKGKAAGYDPPEVLLPPGSADEVAGIVMGGKKK